MRIPRVGDPVAFKPAAFTDYEDLPGIPVVLRGKVIYVNEAHGFYTAEGEVYGYRLRESYRFEEKPNT